MSLGCTRRWHWARAPALAMRRWHRAPWAHCCRALHAVRAQQRRAASPSASGVSCLSRLLRPDCAVSENARRCWRAGRRYSRERCPGLAILEPLHRSQGGRHAIPAEAVCYPQHACSHHCHRHAAHHSARQPVGRRRPRPQRPLAVPPSSHCRAVRGADSHGHAVASIGTSHRTTGRWFSLEAARTSREARRLQAVQPRSRGVSPVCECWHRSRCTLRHDTYRCNRRAHAAGRQSVDLHEQRPHAACQVARYVAPDAMTAQRCTTPTRKHAIPRPSTHHYSW